MSADICEVIQAQTTIACRAMSLNDYMQHLREPAVETPQIWVVDARTDADLDVIVTDALMQDELPLLVGSAGICDALARHVRTPSSQCLLAVVGSMSEIAQQQIAAVRQDPRVETVFIDIANIFSGSLTEYVQRIAVVLISGKHCIVHTCPNSEARHHIPILCAHLKMNRAQLGEKSASFLDSLSGRFCRRYRQRAVSLWR